MSKTKEPPSALAAAVQALDDELVRFEQLATTAQRTPLTSERNLDKASRAINDAADSQRRVGAHIQALIAALKAAQARHDAAADELVRTRDKVQACADRYEARLSRFAALGREAAEISTFVQKVGELKGRPAGEVVATLSQVAERMGRVVEGAAVLGREAQADAMEDLERQCDALKQQVLAALNKVTLLRDKVAMTMS